MPTSYELVAAQFDIAQSYASAASSKVDEFAATLNAALYVAPAIDVTWVDPTLEALPAMPSKPIVPPIAFSAPDVPTPLTPLEMVTPVVTISAFTEPVPTLSFDPAPSISFGTAPTVPAVVAPTVPPAPTLDAVPTPTYLAINSHTFAGVDLHPEMLTALTTIPTLTLVSPTPYSYSVGPDYASALLTATTATITTRMAGGTGLAPAVEQAIWDRSRSRETEIALANENEIMRQSEALGFQLPTGALAAQLRKTQQDYYDKLSGLSRDVAIKQAELEQENMKQTIAMGIELEGKLIDNAFKMEQLTFESAKMTAENALQVYNAQVEQFKALMVGYQTYAAAYKTIIEGEMTKVEVYKAELQAEQTKADINKTLVEQYKAQIEASMAAVQIFQAEIGAANALIQLEQAKVGAAGEQIKAYVATINAETAKVEAYKAQIGAQAELVHIYKVKSEVFTAVTNAEAEKARLALGAFNGKIQAKSAEWEAYRSRVDAEKARMQALASQSDAMWGGFKAEVAKVESVTNTHSRIWESSIKKSEAVATLSLQQSKANTDVIVQANNARLDAAKVGAQVYAQLTSSAYSMVHTNAGVTYQNSAQNSVNYSYRAEASGSPAVLSLIPT